MAQTILKHTTPNVVMLLEGILQFHEEQFVRHLQVVLYSSVLRPYPDHDRFCCPSVATTGSCGCFALQGFYPLFVDLMHCDSKLVRQTLRDIFSNRISTVLQQQQQV